MICVLFRFPYLCRITQLLRDFLQSVLFHRLTVNYSKKNTCTVSSFNVHTLEYIKHALRT